MPGAILYEGPSELDGKPIVVIAVWDSKNSKTGGMLQTYIIRSDIDPRDANKSGEDFSICGDCKLRGVPTDDPKVKLAKKRKCYVTIGQGPLIVFNTYKRGGYPRADTPAKRRAVGKRRTVRIGTYGDGAAVQPVVWRDLLMEALGHTAYTHNGGPPSYYMVSADDYDSAKAAWANKHRTFRIVRHVDEVDRKHEVLCPASVEAGERVQCEQCLLCGGTSVKAKSIAIVVHGSGAVHF